MIHTKHVHIVGIGGIGASAMAKWYLMSGATVSGSDSVTSDITRELLSLGATISIGHKTEHVPNDTELILYSPAILEDNPERKEGVRRGIAQLSYPEFLGELSKEHKTIAVSGTNGKSTTTAMIAKIFISAGYDPVVFLGTKSKDLSHGNFHNGKGIWMIVEACEYREHMKYIVPHIAVITNIERDHLDYYKDIDHIRGAFQSWIDSIKPFDGYVVLNDLDSESKKLTRNDACFVHAEHIRIHEGLQSFTAIIKNREEEKQMALQLSLPGDFNAQNAVMASATALFARIPDANIKKALGEFKGTWRRFEHIGKWQGADIYSDYAHHPTAIQGTIAGVRAYLPERRLIVLFEPHQHSRTKELFNDFVNAFQGTDILILNEIYRVAGRTEDDHVSSKDLVKAIQEKYPNMTIEYTANHEQAKETLARIVKKNDIVIVMGAGTIDEVARELIV